MTNLPTLIEKVKALAAPDAVVFREIFAAVFPKPARIWEDEESEQWLVEYEVYHELSWRFEQYLDAGAWMDAAMTLVPEGMRWAVDTLSGKGEATVAHIDDATGYYVGDEGTGIAPAPALALTIAALQARIGGEGHV